MLAYAFSLLVYILFLATFTYSIGFIEDLVVPKTVDSGLVGPAGIAVATDLMLVLVFAVQHSVMARASFKSRWTKLVPSWAERSCYVLAATLALGVVLWQWRPIPGLLWNVSEPTLRLSLYVLSFGGWGLALASTFAIDHSELFGLRQAFRPESPSQAQPSLKQPWLYRFVRHPLYLGMLMGFWVAPTMTIGHALFAAAMTGYVLVGVVFEERDLVRTFGAEYVRYRQAVGGLLPRLRRIR
jgi:methanethiol S-methyltransferase